MSTGKKTKSSAPPTNPEKVSANEWLDAEIVEKLYELSEKHDSYLRARRLLLHVSEDIKALKKTFALANKNLSRENILEKWESFIELSFPFKNEDEVFSHEYYEYLVNKVYEIDPLNKLRAGRVSRSDFKDDMGVKPLLFPSLYTSRNVNRRYKKTKGTSNDRSSFELSNSGTPKKTIAQLAEEILREKKMGLNTIELKRKIIETGRGVETNTLLQAMNRAKSKFRRNHNKKWILIPESELIQDALGVFGDSNKR